MKLLFIVTLCLVSVNTYSFEELSDEEASREHAGTVLSNDINISILNTVPLFNLIDFNNREFIRNQYINKDGSITFTLNDIPRLGIKSPIGDIEILGLKLNNTEITISKKK